ncbi:hypothetical protein L1049_006421 [Liquidambar formosana]|uniref:Uncharacterized protein n=1 Tax=Liquidambar formosana TaxID=63359 RepID=A0AAP0RFW4_LIQFO
MLMSGDFDLNSFQRYADLVKEELKQTMLNQEVIFRNQVCELHRLYSTQKSLMEDLSWKEFNEYNSWKAAAHPALKPYASSAKYKVLAEERKFSNTSMVGLTQSKNQDLLEDRQGISYKFQHGLLGFQQRPLDLRLPAEQYISHVDKDFPMKGKVLDSLKESGEVKCSLFGDNVCDRGEVKLSLRIGEEGRVKRAGNRSWYNEKTSCWSQDVIDLEESIEGVSNEDAEPVSAPTIYSGDRHDLQGPVLSDPIFSKSVKKDPAQEITLVDGSGSCQDHNLFNQGFKECHGDVPCINMLTKKQQLTSFEAGHFDLNKVQFDDSSSYSNDPEVAYPSTASSSGILHGSVGEFQEGTCPTLTCWRKSNDYCLNETSETRRQDDALNPALMDSHGKDNGTEIRASYAKFKGYSGSEVGSIDLESVSGPPLDPFEDLGSGSSNSENANVDLPLELPNGLLHNQNCTHVATTQVNAAKSEGQDVVSSCPYESQNTVQATPCKSDCVPDNNSSSLKTMQSEIELGDSNLSASNEFPEIQLRPEVSEIPSVEPDLRSSDSSESKHQCYNKKTEEATEVDVLIQKAAESLIQLSLEISVCYPDCFLKAGLNEMEHNEKKQPEYSSDSFESNVLKLTECSADDFSVSSKPFEVNEMETKDFGFKLRRGRRLKDFQRDILPGLASLSRHEIREDINIMEGVIRSREYRRIQASMGHGESWFAPTRSRRTRRNHVGRRYYA